MCFFNYIEVFSFKSYETTLWGSYWQYKLSENYQWGEIFQTVQTSLIFFLQLWDWNIDLKFVGKLNFLKFIC